MIINSSEPAKPTFRSTAVYDGCPYFGLADDAQTRLLFPVTGAVCHLAKPADEIDTAYQQTTCLTTDHKACVVFLRQKSGPLPPEISGIEGQKARSHRLVWGFIVILLFVMVGIWIGLWWVNDGGQMTAFSPMAIPTVNDAAAIVPSARATATAVPPTATIVPTDTAVPTTTPTATQTPTPLLPATFTPRALTPSPPPTAVPPAQVRVNVLRLNVRQGPGIVYDALALIDEGQEFTVIGRVPDGSWLQICCIDGLSGWVIAESVLVEGDVTAVSPITDIPPTPTTTP